MEWRWLVGRHGVAALSRAQGGRKGVASCLLGHMADWAKSPGRKSFGKIGFFEILPRLWKFAQRDFGGILIWRFFLNSSRILKDFRKIQYAMP
jgi:hypothetical protein